MHTLGKAAWEAKWALMVPVIVLGGIYGGVMTPTEAAAIAAFYGMIVGLFLYREMDAKVFFNSCVESCETSSIIIVLMAMATLFGNIMTIEDVPGTIARAILSFTESKIVILLLINVLLLIVGTFMEALAAIVILTPILLPIVTGVGVSPLHFGVIIVVNLAIGFITPPVGVNLFVASGVAKAKLEKIAGMGIQPLQLPDFINNSQVLADDGAGVTASYAFTENVALTAFWVRVLNDNSTAATNRNPGYMRIKATAKARAAVYSGAICFESWARLGKTGRRRCAVRA
jgi:TRAP-type C4-dicarboxylate transport system, large permease component